MTVAWTSDATAFVARDWTRLVRSDPSGTFFHTPRYLKLYWEEFGGDLRLAFVGEGDETVAAVAFDVQGGVLRFLGGTDVTDYLGPVALPAARDRAAKELMAAVAGWDEWERADLRGLPEDSPWLGALADAAAAAGLAAEVGDDSVAPFLPLAHSFDAYLSALPGKKRHELRRKARRLRETLPSARLVDATPGTLREDLDRFVAMHRSSEGPKGRFMQPGMELFFRRLAYELLPDGILRLAFLEADGRKVAGIVGFRDDDRFLLYNSAYDHAWARVSPGIVLVVELIRSAIEEGCRGLDLLKDDLAYKYGFGAAPRPVRRLVLTRR